MLDGRVGDNPALFILRISFAHLQGILTEERKVAAGQFMGFEKRRKTK